MNLRNKLVTANTKKTNIEYVALENSIKKNRKSNGNRLETYRKMIP